jgi:lipid-A-disaccharide synthase
MSFINFLIVKMLVKTKFANIINIAAKEEIIPELLQSDCNANNIFKKVSNFLDNPDKIEDQVNRTQKIIKELKTKQSSTDLAAKSLIRFLQI